MAVHSFGNATQYEFPFGFPFFASLLLFVCWGSLSGCGKEKSREETKAVSDRETRRLSEDLRRELPLTLAEGLGISLWASEEILSDPVGINFDEQGRAWVATTSRRRTTVPDAGAVSRWDQENLSWTSVGDRKDFFRRELTPENSEKNRGWLTDFNGDGIRDIKDMTVERDSVYLLEDRTGDGFANRARVMDWDHYSEITEITGSVLYHRGDLFVARAPDLLRIRDEDGDGIWESPDVLSHGYAIHLGYSGHGMSGLKTGPDGRIYWAIGDIGVNVKDDRGRRWFYPDEGAILRADPDGSNFEVYASGLRNVHEFDFDKYGNLIGVDNNGPGKDFDRLVYPVNGSDSGWRIYWQMGKYGDPKNNDYRVWTEEEYYNTAFEGQAAHVLPPVAPGYPGPAGLAYHPGTALSGEWEDYFFASSFMGSPARSGIDAFKLREKGATFEVDTSRTVLRGLLSTSLDFDPGGALYTADWIEGWVPKGTGRIWKIDTPDTDIADQRRETADLLARSMQEVPASELSVLLAHDDMRVRKKAQFELAARNDSETLLEVVCRAGHRLARLHGIWGVAQIGRQRPETVEPLTAFLGDTDPEIRAQTARMLGDVRYEPAAEALIPLLGDRHPRPRFFAAEALGRIGYGPAVPHIVTMLEQNNGEDAYLQNAGFIALARIGDTDALSGLGDHESPAVRKAVLVALRRLGDAGVVRFLEDVREDIVTDAARAINDEEFIEEGLPALAQMLEQDRFTNEALMRRAMNASLYLGTEEDASRLASFALRNDIPDELKIEALAVLSVWEESSVYDRVTGKYRGVVRNDPGDARRAARPAVAELLSGAAGTVQIAALQLAGTLKVEELFPEILRIARSGISADVRIAALDALQKMEYDKIDEVISAALSDEVPEVRMNAVESIPGLGLPVEETVELLESVLDTGTPSEKQTALAALQQTDHPASHTVLEEQLDLLLDDMTDREIRLDLILAAEAANAKSIQEKLSRYYSQKNPEDSVGVYEETLYGGDADRGEQIFRNDAYAQCITCHPSGGGAGPPLDGIGSRLSRKQLLEALVDPGAGIAPGYGSVTVILKNGQAVSGIPAAETQTHLTLQQGGEELEIPKAEIDERRNAPSSMPAMGEILTRTELRDMVEYLASLDEDE